MDAREYLLLEYAWLPDGSTAAGELCPTCKGGDARERTLSVSRRDASLVWICHRDSCGFKGREGSTYSGAGLVSGPVNVRGVWGRQIDAQSLAVPEAVRQTLEDRYRITARHIQAHELGWDADSQRLVIPVKDFLGNRLGVTLRALDKRTPKSLTHTEQGAVSWHVNHTVGGVIIVEDQLSAIRASDYLSSVALLGTNLSEDTAYGIRRAKRSPVYLALDADAWRTTIRHTVEHRATLAIRPLRVSKDLKDHSDEELAMFFANINEEET